MTIDEKIKSLNPYFRGLNVVDDGKTFFILIKLPDNWKVFDEEELKNRFNVYIGKKNEGLYFMTDSENGFDCLFDAIQEVISQNKSLEEKAELFKQLTVKLRDLFVSEPLEKLKTLEFTFATKKSSRRPKNVVKTENTEKETEPEVKEEVVVKEKVEEKKQTASNKKAKKETKNNKDSDVMSFMKEIEGVKK